MRGGRIQDSGVRGWLACLIALAGCSHNPQPSAAPAAQGDGAIHVTLLHINDVYEITPVEAGHSGGLARVATVLARLRQENPATRMLLGGDFVSPSAIGTARVNGERLAGRQMVAVLNAAGLDVATLGNHEFALIKDSADAIVALTHLRLADDVTLADSLPELDLILGGHEHENWSIRRGDRFTPIIKADANVRSVAIVDLTVRPGTRPFVNWRIVTITDSIAETPAVAAEAKRWTTIAYDAFRKDGLEPERVIATLPTSLDAREVIIRNGENDFTRLLTGALLREAPDADVALMNSGSIRLDDVLPSGPITEYDVIRLLPFGGKVVEVEMTGALLQQVLEQGDKNRGIGGFLLRANAETGAGGWTIGGAPLDARRRYRVVTPDFLVSGGEQNLGYLSETNSGLKMLRSLRDIRVVVIAELVRRHGR